MSMPTSSWQHRCPALAGSERELTLPLIRACPYCKQTRGGQQPSALQPSSSTSSSGSPPSDSSDTPSPNPEVFVARAQRTAETLRIAIQLRDRVADFTKQLGSRDDVARLIWARDVLPLAERLDELLGELP